MEAVDVVKEERLSDANRGPAFGRMVEVEASLRGAVRTATVLIVGNETLTSPELQAAVSARPRSGSTIFYIVVPATPIEHGLTWDEAETNRVAATRLVAMLDRIHALGAKAAGEVGSKDPVAAVRDALREHAVDEIILSTLPSGISRWLGQDVPTRLAKAVAVPVTVVTAERLAVRSA